uniref:Reverse transcriptase domain-containing protein n=1 Tax=Tanacetum cinerariifolium TaxID=118510 RepID=A0A699HPX7_TANCI|nr:reverse transcriptase domain-containing protein [Tanacetum cinerariifolium]
MLERRTKDVLKIIENKSKVCNSRNKSVVSQVKSSDANSNSSSEIAKLTHAVNQQTSAVTTAMTAILEHFQATPPPAFVKAVEEICFTCGGAHPYYQCLAAEKVKRMNEANMKAMQTQINNVKNELRNEMKNSIQASMSNQTNELKNMMASFYQMNIASTLGSGSLPINTIDNLKGELKAITTQSGIVLDGPSVPIPPPFINLEEDERVEDPLHSNIPYPSRMLKQKQQEKDEVQIHEFWQMFKQLHINITLTDALILIPKYQRMHKAILSNKEKLQELTNTPLNENFSMVILKKLPILWRCPRRKLWSKCSLWFVIGDRNGEPEIGCPKSDLTLVYNLGLWTTIRSKQPFIFEESPVDTMVGQHTMAKLLCAPTEGHAESIVVPPILADQFELKHSLINMMTTDQFFGLEKDNPHDHIRCALNAADQEPLNAVAGGNLLERRTQDVLIIIENKSKVRNSQNKLVVSQLKSCDANSSSEIAKLTHAVNQQTSVVTTAMTSILKKFQATPAPASLKAVEEICVTCGGAHPYYQCLAAGGNIFLELRDNIQGYVSAAAINYNQGNSGYCPPGSGSLPSNTVANPKGKLKAINTQSGLVIDGPTIPTPPLFINPEEDERAEESLTDPNLSKYTIKVPPPLVKNTSLCLPDLISTCMTLKLANRAICTPAGIARDVFVPVGKFTFPADFVIVDYESDPRVPLILGRSFLRTARALIDVHGEEMILHDGDDRLTLNMRHNNSNYSNQPQKESINLNNVFNNSRKDFLEDLFSNQPSGNRTFSSHPELTSSKVQNDIFDSEGGNFLPEKLLDLDSIKDLHPPLYVNLLSGSTTYSSSPNPLLEELVDKLALITFSPKYDDDLYDLANPADNFVDSMPEMFTDEHALDYSSPPIFDEYDDDFLEVESEAKNVFDDPFDSKGEKIKESKLLIDELDLPCDFLPPSEYDSFVSQDFFRVDAKPSTNNENKVFNPGILSQEKLFEINTRVV